MVSKPFCVEFQHAVMEFKAKWQV